MSSIKLLLAILLLSIGAQAQFFSSETGRKVGEKLAHGDRAGALAILDAAIANGKDLDEAYQMRANNRFASGDVRGCVEDLSAAIQLKPDDPQLYKQRAQFRLFLRDSDGALKDYDSAVGHGLKSDEVFTGRARVKADVGDLDGAIVDYRNALAANPNYAAAYLGIARLDEKRGDIDAAILELRQFIDAYEVKREGVLPTANGGMPTGDNVIIKREGREPDGSQVVMAGVGSVMTFKVDSPEQLNRSIRAHEQAVNVSQAYITLGRLYQKKSDVEKALVNLDKGLQVLPSDGQGRQLRAEIRMDKGDLAGAIDDYKVAAASPLPGVSVLMSKCILLTLQNNDSAAQTEMEALVRAYPGEKTLLEQRIAQAKKLREQKSSEQ